MEDDIAMGLEIFFQTLSSQLAVSVQYCNANVKFKSINAAFDEGQRIC